MRKKIFVLCWTSIIVMTLSIMFIVLFHKTDGTLIEQFAYIKKNYFKYGLGYFFMSLNTFAVTPIVIILALFIKTKKQTKLLDVVGVVLLSPYPILSMIGYGSQYFLFPNLLENVKSVDIISIWHFQNPASIPYALDLLGYLFFGLSTMLIGYKYFFQKATKWIAIWLYASGVLCVFALVFHSFLYYDIGQNISKISGALTFPWLILLMIKEKYFEYKNVISE